MLIELLSVTGYVHGVDLLHWLPLGHVEMVWPNSMGMTTRVQVEAQQLSTVRGRYQLVPEKTQQKSVNLI